MEHNEDRWFRVMGFELLNQSVRRFAAAILEIEGIASESGRQKRPREFRVRASPPASLF
jgi:hypothetical protein